MTIEVQLGNNNNMAAATQQRPTFTINGEDINDTLGELKGPSSNGKLINNNNNNIEKPARKFTVANGAPTKDPGMTRNGSSNTSLKVRNDNGTT